METDLRQGALGDTVHHPVGRRKQWRFKVDEWVWLFQRQLRAMAQDARLKGAHWRILAYLMSCATFAQDIQVRQKEVAQTLGLTHQTVSRVLAELAALGIIARVATHSYPPTYRLNSQYVYKGHGEQLPQRRAYQGKGCRRG